MADIAQLFDKDYEQKEFNELVDAPVDAIQGLSQGDAEKLKAPTSLQRQDCSRLGREQVRAHSSGRGHPFGFTLREQLRSTAPPLKRPGDKSHLAS
jgi:hypothetical protein